MTTSDETDWEFFTLWESLRKFINTVQGSNETPNEFRKRFEERSKVVKALLGDNFLEKFNEATQGYEVLPGSGVDGIESDVQIEYKSNTWEMLLASGMLYNSDRARFQSRIGSMNAAYMVVHQDYGQRMTYPTTVHHTTETMNRHKADNRKSKNVKNVNNNGSGSQTGSNGSRNRNLNHESSHGNSGNMGTNLAQTGNTSSRACYVCGGRDHVAPSCTDRFKPKSEWWKPDKYKNYSNLQTETESSNRSNLQTGSSNGGSNTDGGTGSNQGRNNSQWSFAQYQKQYYGQSNDQDDENSFIQVADYRENATQLEEDFFNRQMEEGISADSGSTFRLLKPGHVKEGTIRNLQETFSYGSNVGSRDITTEGESKLFANSMGKIDPEAAHTVESLSQLRKEGWHIFMDTRNWDGITVHRDDHVVRFPERNGLYTWMPNDNEDLEFKPTWIDELGSKLLYEQFGRVKTLKGLIDLNDGIDPHTEYVLERETEIYDIMKKDLENGNPSSWVEDMIYRARFGKNQALQEHSVGGKVSRANMHKVLTRMYDEIPDKYC